MPGKHGRKTTKRPSQAARRTGSVRASMENSNTRKRPKRSTQKKMKVSIGRDVRTGKFVSLTEASKRPRDTQIENYSRKTRGKAKKKS